MSINDLVGILYGYCSWNKSRMWRLLKTQSVHKMSPHRVNEELIERTIPEKPKGRLQKYRLSHKGKILLEKSHVPRLVRCT